jgi:hypothetical protein
VRLLDSVSPSPGLDKPPDVEQEIFKQNMIPAVLLVHLLLMVGDLQRQIEMVFEMSRDILENYKTWFNSMFDDPDIVVSLEMTYLENQSMTPTSSPASVSPPWDPRRGEYHSLAGEGVGGPNSDGLDRKPGTMYTLCMTWSISGFLMVDA